MDNLTEIYPFGKMMDVASFNPALLQLPVGNRWFVLPKDRLSVTEIKMLQQIFPENTKNEARKHVWYRILLENEPIKEAGYFRVLQVKLSPTSEHTRREWLENILEMIAPIDHFWLTKDILILVEHQNRKTFSLTDLKGLFATLDADFFVTTKIFAGSFYEAHENFSLLFKEEQEIFAQEEARFLKDNFLSLSLVALDFLTKEKISSSHLMQSFRRVLLKDDELLDIVEALILNQGNVSSAAKDLFMHRNTLQYRLDKFHEQTGFNLKEMEDLALCYLLVRNKERA
ncbi:helix-turn-helix domain-containing protein [Enterococcus timonensis]|uniref:helix-turn-helix domain-containing protein n=1 Tax=Enterococcus timonensis TaxID=1852364 RepID=UPI0008DA1D0E|nr:helix-turn-helix domain-containing protein [Enterococcus timonensis]